MDYLKNQNFNGIHDSLINIRISGFFFPGCC